MKTSKLTLNKVFPYLLIIGGAIALFASFILTHDTLAIDKNSHYIPSCNLNPVLSCGDVITAKGDTVLGLPYPFFGIAVFAVLIVLGASLLAGAKFKKWYWQTYAAMLGLGTLSAYYLLIKSMYTIHALCPFCLSVDVVTTTVFWYSTLYVLDNKYIDIKNNQFKKVYGFVRAHHLDILVLWFLLVIAFILHHFWYYYGKHL